MKKLLLLAFLSTNLHAQGMFDTQPKDPFDFSQLEVKKTKKKAEVKKEQKTAIKKEASKTSVVIEEKKAVAVKEIVHEKKKAIRKEEEEVSFKNVDSRVLSREELYGRLNQLQQANSSFIITNYKASLLSGSFFLSDNDFLQGTTYYFFVPYSKDEISQLNELVISDVERLKSEGNYSADYIEKNYENMFVSFREKIKEIKPYQNLINISTKKQESKHVFSWETFGSITMKSSSDYPSLISLYENFEKNLGFNSNIKEFSGEYIIVESDSYSLKQAVKGWVYEEKIGEPGKPKKIIAEIVPFYISNNYGIFSVTASADGDLYKLTHLLNKNKVLLVNKNIIK